MTNATPSPANLSLGPILEAAAAATSLAWSRNQHGMLRAAGQNGFIYSIVRPSNYGEGWKAYLERHVQWEYRGIEITTTATSEIDAQRICNRDAATRVDWRASRTDAEESASSGAHPTGSTAQGRAGPVSATGTGTRSLALGNAHPQGDPPGLFPAGQH